MNSKTEIMCNVHSCVFQKDGHCDASTISVGCNDCIMPNSICETECRSFKCNCGK